MPHSGWARIKNSSLAVFDALLVILAAWIVIVLLSGGGVFYVGDIRVSSRSTRNLIYALYLLGTLRFLVGRQTCFLGVRGFDLRELPRHAGRFAMGLRTWLLSFDARRTGRLLVFVVIASFALKLVNAAFYFGFYSGDDVEIHEMSFAQILDADWPMWDLRSAFYPLRFIYPAQKIAYELGAQKPEYLILAGRVVVVLFSLANLLLTFVIAKRLFSTQVGVLSVLILACNGLHNTMAGSVLPRTVASTFVLIAFVLLQSKSALKAGIVAGMSLAVAACIRFSEAVFLIPAIAQLVHGRRVWHASVLLLAVAGGATAVQAVSDWLYWDRPFQSFVSAFEYTIMEGQTSRGTQSVVHYVVALREWANIFVVWLVIEHVRARRTARTRLTVVTLWTFVPILVLSILPHKEARYLLPIVPFLSIMAGSGAWEMLTKLEKQGDRVASGGLGGVVACAVLLGVFLLGMDGSRFRRTESAVELARYVRDHHTTGSVAAQHSWAIGGRLYLGTRAPLVSINISALERTTLDGILQNTQVEWLALRAGSVPRDGHEALIRSHGFERVHYTTRTDPDYNLYKRSLDAWRDSPRDNPSR